MRLTPDEVTTIKAAAAREAFGAGVIVRLFGSRVHDHRKGGDIDLLIETVEAEPDYRARSRFLDLTELRRVGRRSIWCLFNVANC